MLNPNVPAWFEIPANRLDRAQKFYETILGVQLKRAEAAGDSETATRLKRRIELVSG